MIHKSTSANEFNNLFFIIKGQYDHHDPEDPNTKEWYQLIEKKTYRVLSCGASLDNILENMVKLIMRNKTEDKLYRSVCSNRESHHYKGGEIMVNHHKLLERDYGDCYKKDIEELVSKCVVRLLSKTAPVGKVGKIHLPEEDGLLIKGIPQRKALKLVVKHK